MAKNSWKILSQGSDRGLVLAVDFSHTGRSQASFRDLVGHLNPRLTVWETLPPTGRHVPPHGYVDWWLGEIRQSDQPVRAVLGYCAGAVLAAQMVERIATWQDEPLLVLLDPELPNTFGLYRDFRTVGDSMAGLLSKEELCEFHQAVQRVQEKYNDDDICRVGLALCEVFSAAIATAAKRLDLDNEIRDELADVFDSLVQYLVAATLFDPLAIWARSPAIRSREPDGAPLKHGSRVGREITIDVKHHDLLRYGPAAHVVSDLIAQRMGG